MGNKTNKQLKNQKENTIRINTVKAHIEKNVTKKLPLVELASIANFSPFHFQKIFKSIVGETPKQYIKRLRLEATAHHIVLKPKASLLEVAIEYGFNSLEAFSRAFKNYYGHSPSTFREKTNEGKTAILQSKTNSSEKNGINPTSFLPPEMDAELENIEVKIVKLPPKKLIFISVTLKDIDTVAGGYKRIKQWAFARGLIKPGVELFALMRDYPAFTALDKCRFLTCISVDTKPDISGEVDYQEIPSRTYATFKIDGGIDELVKSVTKFITHWLPESGFEICHSPAIIIPLDDPIANHPHDISYQFYLAVSPK